MNMDFWIKREYKENENMLELMRQRKQMLKEKLNTEDKLLDYLVELEVDFAYVRSLNKQISMRYDEMFACFPTAEELEYTIEAVFEDKLKYPITEKKRRLDLLVKFKSALKMLENFEQLKAPPKYEDLENDDDLESVAYV